MRKGLTSSFWSWPSKQHEIRSKIRRNRGGLILLMHRSETKINAMAVPSRISISSPTAGSSGCLSYFPNWRIREQKAIHFVFLSGPMSSIQSFLWKRRHGTILLAWMAPVNSILDRRHLMHERGRRSKKDIQDSTNCKRKRWKIFSLGLLFLPRHSPPQQGMICSHDQRKRLDLLNLSTSWIYQ